MRRRIKATLMVLGALVIGLVVLVRPQSLPAGVHTEEVTAPDPADQPLPVRVWYPDTPARNLPLIVISHGTGGSETGHADTAAALAKAGFVVAAVRHTGDNYRDDSYVGHGKHLSGRPRHVSRVIDYMLRQWSGHDRIDPARIGLFGHSAGGFTGLVVAGGEPDLRKVAEHCRAEPGAWDCGYLKSRGIQPGRFAGPPAWDHDPRVKAVSIAAPAVGYTFAPDRLAAVTVPVQLWDAGKDDIVDRSAATIRTLLPQPPEYHLTTGAGHFAYLDPCGLGMRATIAVMTWSGTPDICGDPDGFDRTAFHRRFNRDVVAFFGKTLVAAPSSR